MSSLFAKKGAQQQQQQQQPQHVVSFAQQPYALSGVPVTMSASSAPRDVEGVGAAAAGAAAAASASSHDSSSSQPQRLTVAQREEIFSNILQQDQLNMREVRAACFYGIPDGKGLRAVYWRLLLDYLPPRRADWDATLLRKRAQYQSFCREMIVNPHVMAPASDHPLNLEAASKWKEHFDDQEVWSQIDKDVRRTHPDYAYLAHEQERELSDHKLAITRILFLYAKLNPGLSYVQGMNELLAPIYFVFARYDPEFIRGSAEADTFWCFTSLMAEVRDHFCKSLDATTEGIRATLNRFQHLLSIKDSALYAELEHKDIMPQYYALRWITLLLSQEFDLPDTLRLWDTLFSDERRFEFLLYFCLAMVIHVRDEIMAADFAETVKMLQRYPPTDMDVLLRLAQKLRDS